MLAVVVTLNSAAPMDEPSQLATLDPAAAAPVSVGRTARKAVLRAAGALSPGTDLAAASYPAL